MNRFQGFADGRGGGGGSGGGGSRGGGNNGNMGLVDTSIVMELVKGYVRTA